MNPKRIALFYAWLLILALAVQAPTDGLAGTKSMLVNGRTVQATDGAQTLKAARPEQSMGGSEDWSDHVTSAFRGTITNEGNIGWLNSFPPGGTGSGFQFNPVTTAGQRLFEGALMIGLDSTRVSDAARDELQVFDADFLFLSTIDSSLSSGTTTVYSTSYNDDQAEVPIGIQVDQTSYSYDEAGKNNILIMQFDITNTSGGDLNGLVAGAYFDWDVNPATAADRGAVIVDSMNTIPGVNGGNPFPFDLLELHQGVGPTAYMGSVPLNENRFYGRRIAIQATEIYPPHMTEGDKWRYMTQLRAANPNGDSGLSEDHGHVFGIGPYNVLQASATKRVGFAIVAGSTLQACIDAAQEAQRIWVEDLGNTLNVHAPNIAVSGTLVFHAGEGDSYSLNLLVRNTATAGNPDLVWSASDDGCAWISSISPSGGSIPAGGSTMVAVTADATGLTAGVYNCDVIITSDDPDTPEVTRPATLNVYDPEVTGTISIAAQWLPIPAGGDTVPMSISFTNLTALQKDKDLWITLTPPAMPERVVLGPKHPIVPGFAMVSKSPLLIIGAGFPSGTYTITLKLGTYPSTVEFSASFMFMKSATGLARLDQEQLFDATWETGVPQEMSLGRNYPNPFNPSTSVRYGLNKDTWVSLKIYNTLGQEIATLVDEFQTAGVHAAEWNGRAETGQSVASGVYIYRLSAGDFVQTERMLLSK